MDWEAEKLQYIEAIKNLNNEKIALDQSYVVSIRECLELRKQLLLKDTALNDIQAQLNKILQENMKQVPVIPVNEDITQDDSIDPMPISTIESETSSV